MPLPPVPAVAAAAADDDLDADEDDGAARVGRLSGLNFPAWDGGFLGGMMDYLSMMLCTFVHVQVQLFASVPSMHF